MALPKIIVSELPGTSQADIVAMKAKIDTIQTDIAIIKNQNLEPQDADLSFVFATGDSGAKTAALGLTGLLKHVYLEIPETTNNITITPSIRNAAGKVIWQGPAVVDNANYRIDQDDVKWLGDQVLDGDELLVMTPSGAPGGDGVTVSAYARAFGVAGE